MIKPIMLEYKKQYFGSNFCVRYAAASEPVNPPIAKLVQLNEVSSSEPTSGYFLDWITINESTTTSANATLKFEKTRHEMANVSD